jgi:uncharacterized protein YcnI
MKKIKLLVLAVATLLSGSAMAQKIVCPAATLEEGTANLVFSIAENEDATATLAQFVLNMPDGITVEKNSKGRYVYVKGELMQEDHTVTFQDKTNGDILFLVKNEYGEEFTAANGELVSFNILADESLADGTYQISVTDVNITNLGRQKIAKETSFTIAVTKGATGIKEVEADGMQADGKYLKDGKIVIKKGSKLYNAVGAITK